MIKEERPEASDELVMQLVTLMSFNAGGKGRQRYKMGESLRKKLERFKDESLDNVEDENLKEAFNNAFNFAGNDFLMFFCLNIITTLHLSFRGGPVGSLQTYLRAQLPTCAADGGGRHSQECRQEGHPQDQEGGGQERGQPAEGPRGGVQAALEESDRHPLGAGEQERAGAGLPGEDRLFVR